jgi:polar amino acid transport system substrate-binding protein
MNPTHHSLGSFPRGTENESSRMGKNFFLSVILIMVSGIANAASQEDFASTSVLEAIKDRGSIRVGVAMFLPWSMRDKKGNLIGFEIDVAKKVAADMKVDVKLVPTAWGDLIPQLNAKKSTLSLVGCRLHQDET